MPVTTYFDDLRKTLGDLTETTKAAGHLAAAEARKARLVKITLPAAYRALGRNIFSDGRFRSEYPEVYAEIDGINAEITRLTTRHDGDLQGAFVEKAKQTVSKIKDKTQAKALGLKLGSLMRRLGDVSFVDHKERSGPEPFVDPINACLDKIRAADEEIRQLSNPNDDRWLRPRRILYGVISALGVLVFCAVANRSSKVTLVTPTPSVSSPVPIIAESVSGPPPSSAQQVRNDRPDFSKVDYTDDFSVRPKPALTSNAPGATLPVTPSTERGKLEPFFDSLVGQGKHGTLFDVQHFIDVPSGAKELPDVTLSQSFYPFLKRGKWFPRYNVDTAIVDTAMGPGVSGVLGRLYVMRHEPGGKLREEDRVRVLVDRSDGSVRVLPKTSADTEPSLNSEGIRLYRVRNGFVEIGMPSGTTVFREQVIKIGAKKGDTWDSSSRSDDGTGHVNESSSRVVTVFSYHDEPCAVIEQDEVLPNPKVHYRKTTWYLNGKGDMRTESRQIAESGRESTLYRSEMISWTGEPCYSSE